MGDDNPLEPPLRAEVGIGPVAVKVAVFRIIDRGSYRLMERIRPAAAAGNDQTAAPIAAGAKTER